MKTRNLLAVGCSLALLGCTNWETSSVAPSEVVNQGNAFSAKSIQLSAEPLDPARYVKISDLAVSVNKATVFNPDPTVSAVESKLQQEAYQLGATDVFEVRITDIGVSMLSYGTRKGFGVAAKRK